MSVNDDQTSKQDLVKFSKEVNLTETENHDLFITSVKDKIRTITVEPLMMFYIIIMYLQLTVNGQYINFRVGIDYHIVVNETLAHVCKPGDNNTDKSITDRIQELNARYSMLIQLSTSVSTIITAPFYCVFSDRFGRKIMFLLPGVGLFIKTMLEICVQQFQWNLSWLMVTEGFYGLCGGYNFITGLSYSYIADITTQKDRTKRMAILVILVAVGALVVSLVAGVWIRASGYLIPYIFTGVLSVLCIVYPIVYLREPPKMHDHKRDKEPVLKQLKNLFTIYTTHSRVENALLIIVLIFFNFYYVAEMSNLTMTSTYLMAFPICMDIVRISLFSFLNMASLNIGIGITILLLRRWFSDLVVVILCLLSGIIYSMQMAFLRTPESSYIAASTNLLSFSAFPLVRGYMSKKVEPRDQGALFGGLVLTETISGAISKVICIYFYGATFRIFHGMVFLFLTSFSVIALLLVLVAILLDRRIKASKPTDPH